MPQFVCNGATISCSFGTTPSQLTVLPARRVNGGKMPLASIMDHAPMTNVMPFGMCTTVSNPQVASATSAAGGTLTPQPCIPVTPGPWTPGSATVNVGKQPSLHSACQLQCTWGGVITVANPGQQTVNVS